MPAAHGGTPHDIEIFRDHGALGPAFDVASIPGGGQPGAMRRVGLQTSHHGEQLLARSEELAPCRLLQDLRERTEAARNDGSALAERLDEHDAERLVALRGDDERDRVLIVATERIRRDTAEEPYVRQPLGEGAKRRCVLPIASDDEVRIGELAEERDDVVEPLDALEATGEEEIRARMRRLALGSRQTRARLGIRKEIGEHFHVAGEAELAVLAAAELAHRDHGVDRLELMLEVTGGAPELRRPTV